MNPLSSMLQLVRKWAASPEDPRISLSQWYSELTGSGGDMVELPVVTEQSARTVSAMYRGVNLLAGAVAILPLRVIHQPSNAISKVADNHKLAPLLKASPMPGSSMTAHTFKTLIMQSRAYGGNFFARIVYDGAGRIVGLRYYPYQRVTVVPKLTPPYTRYYKLVEPDGTLNDPVPDDEVLHIMGEANDGLMGESLISTNAKQSLQMHLFLQQQARSVHNNAVKASGVVGLPPGATATTKTRYEAFFKLKNQGSANAGNILVMDAGASYTPLSPALSLVDLNTIEFLRYSVNDIARFLGIPSHLLNEQSQTSAWGSGIESLGRSFLLYTLEPHLRAIEEELRLKLFGQGDYFPQFDRSPLLATDAQTQAQVESTKINTGIWQINERRMVENLPAVEYGNQSFVNGTMVPLSVAANKAEATPLTPPPKKKPGPAVIPATNSDALMAAPRAPRK